MAIVPQHATGTADTDGDATFVFPDVPQGELWCGTTQVPSAPASLMATVSSSGELLGSMNGSGSYGPWTCGATRKLTISASGLVPGTQYEAIWHADTKGNEFSTYPAPITPTVVASGTSVTVTNFPAIQEVDGTVNVGNFPATQPVSGTVTAAPELAATVPAGATAMTGSAVTLPNHAAVQGVVLSAPSANAHPLTLNGGFVMEPGQTTPLLPVANLDLISATGTSPDVLSWVVT